jgi:hypothetical protein
MSEKKELLFFVMCTKTKDGEFDGIETVGWMSDAVDVYSFAIKQNMAQVESKQAAFNERLGQARSAKDVASLSDLLRETESALRALPTRIVYDVHETFIPKLYFTN